MKTITILFLLCLIIQVKAEDILDDLHIYGNSYVYGDAFIDAGALLIIGDEENDEAKVHISNSDTSLPGLIVGNTWEPAKNGGDAVSDPDEYRPFQVRRHQSNRETFSTFLADKVTWNTYRNDEDAGYIKFHIDNLDWLTGGGNGPNKNSATVLTLKANASGSYVGINATNPDVALEVNGDIKASGQITTASGSTYLNTSNFSESHINSALGLPASESIATQEYVNDEITRATDYSTSALQVGGIVLGDATQEIEGAIRYDSSSHEFKGHNGTSWQSLNPKRVQNRVNVVEKGIANDGSNVSQQLQDLINAAPVVNGKYDIGNLYFPSGDYTFSVIIPDNSYVSISGEGASTGIRPATVTEACFTIAGDIYAKNGKVYGLQVDRISFSGHTSGGQTGCAIRFANTATNPQKAGIFSHLFFYDLNVAIDFDVNAYGNRFLYLNFYNCNYGTTFEDTALDDNGNPTLSAVNNVNLWLACRFQLIKKCGIYAPKMMLGAIRDCWFEGNSTDNNYMPVAVYLNGSDTEKGFSNVIANCWFEDVGLPSGTVDLPAGTFESHAIICRGGLLDLKGAIPASIMANSSVINGERLLYNSANDKMTFTGENLVNFESLDSYISSGGSQVLSANESTLFEVGYIRQKHAISNRMLLAPISAPSNVTNLKDNLACDSYGNTSFVTQNNGVIQQLNDVTQNGLPVYQFDATNANSRVYAPVAMTSAGKYYVVTFSVRSLTSDGEFKLLTDDNLSANLFSLDNIPVYDSKWMHYGVVLSTEYAIADKFRFAANGNNTNLSMQIANFQIVEFDRQSDAAAWIAKGQIAATPKTVSRSFDTAKSGAASPVNVVVPNYVGQEYLDVTNSKWYKSTGMSTAKWVELN